MLTLADRNTSRILDLKGDAELIFPVFGRPLTLLSRIPASFVQEKSRKRFRNSGLNIP